jgi:hypothetical protein
MVQALGDQLLAGPALADYQHRSIERRSATRPLDRVEKGEALPNELIGPLHNPLDKNLADCWWQIPPIGKVFRALCLVKNGVFPELRAFLAFGTALVW